MLIDSTKWHYCEEKIGNKLF